MPAGSWTLAAYRFALDPAPRRERNLVSHCGAARFAPNWTVSWARAAWDQRVAEASYGVAEDELTARGSRGRRVSLRKASNQVKGEVAPWWGENSKTAC